MSVPYEITGHALERLEERFPNEYPDSDVAAAELIQAEIEDALATGRWGKGIPPEFAQDGTATWQDEFCWARHGRRGYVIRDSGHKVTVITTLARTFRPHRLVKPVGETRHLQDQYRELKSHAQLRHPTGDASSADTSERDA